MLLSVPRIECFNPLFPPKWMGSDTSTSNTTLISGKVLSEDTVSFKSVKYADLPFDIFKASYEQVMEYALQVSIRFSKRTSLPISEALTGKVTEIEIPIKSSNQRVHAWDIRNKDNKKWIIYYYGAGDNRTSGQGLYKEILDNGYNILVHDYGGFGKDTGNMAPKTLRLYNQALMDYLKKNGVKAEDTGVIAQCIGAFPATELAKTNPNLKFLILTSPVNSIKNFAVHNIAAKDTKPSFIVKNFKLDDAEQAMHQFPYALDKIDNVIKTETNVAEITVPTHIIYSKQDRLLPPGDVERIAKHTKNLASSTALENAPHGPSAPMIEVISKILGINIGS